MTNEERIRKHTLRAVGAFKAVIDNDYAFDNTTLQLCALYGISRNVLQHHFKQQVGMGIRNYKLTQRMQLSRHLLEKGKDVKEIAILLHYTKTRAFCAAFKKYYRITPSQFVNSLPE